MICSEFGELLDGYELLSGEQRSTMEKHTSECETCRREYEFFKSIISISASIPSPKAPDTLIDAVNAKLDAETAAPAKFRLNLRALSSVAACLAIGVAVGVNNGYIKKNIGSVDTDGVISENVVSTQQPKTDNDSTTEETKTPEAPKESVKSEPKAEVENAVKTKKKADNTKKVAETPKPTVKVEEKTEKLNKSEKPISTPSQKPVKAEEKAEPEKTVPPQTPEPTNTIDSYALRYDGSQIAYGYYNTETKQRTPSTISDYLHVDSNDMGAVVSTMSEMGFKYGSGYYMTPRENFYEFIDRLDSAGIDYEYDLKYNSGDGISFRLTYN